MTQKIRGGGGCTSRWIVGQGGDNWSERMWVTIVVLDMSYRTLVLTE